MHYKTLTVSAQKCVALVAHDQKKEELIEWAVAHKEALKSHTLCATGTTGRLLEQKLGLAVEKFVSGPLGGDQQIGAAISQGKIDVLVFFWDPFESQPHDPDVKALLRIAAVWNIPVACNLSTANYIFSSDMILAAHKQSTPDYESYLATRVE